LLGHYTTIASTGHGLITDSPPASKVVEKKSEPQIQSYIKTPKKLIHFYASQTPSLLSICAMQDQ
jgi:hypothetical protein